ncbi:MAG: glutathione S-transferase, partial [Myxococcales bacterium]|nr:glutathione S-transferase [Myxococcales bacterium]
DRSRRQDPEFLALNPMGQVPVIDDGGVVLADSNAILVYLARRYDRAGRWYPVDEPAQAARVQRWLSIAAGELRYGPAFARAAKVFGVAIDEALTQSTSARVLALLERSLAGAAFLVGDGPTIADVALYTYTAHAPEGGLSLAPYPNLRAWLERVEALPGFVAMLRSAA